MGQNLQTALVNETAAAERETYINVFANGLSI